MGSRDVIAPGLQLNDPAASGATLPLILRGCVHQNVQLVIAWAWPIMIASFARCAGPLQAASALARRCEDSVGPDERRAMRNIAVRPIHCLKLDTLCAEFAFAAVAEERLDQLPSELLLATSRWKERLVRHCGVVKGLQTI